MSNDEISSCLAGNLIYKGTFSKQFEAQNEKYSQGGWIELQIHAFSGEETLEWTFEQIRIKFI